MAMIFDATMKDLARGNAEDFATTFDQLPSGPLSLLNVDLSTITTAADLVIGIGQPLHEILHLDFQASAAATKHADILVYNALLYRHCLVPVHSIIILLRSQAVHFNLDGLVRYASRPARGSMNFSYEVVRLWEWPAEQLLAGGLGTVPLAPLGQLPTDVSLEDGLAAIVQRVVNRITTELPLEKAKHLITAAYLLTGLRVHRNTARDLFRGVRTMHESDTYMAIIDEGREKEAKNIILRMGQKRFGPANETIRARLAAIEDIDRLEALAERLLDVNGWDQLFENP